MSDNEKSLMHCQICKDEIDDCPYTNKFGNVQPQLPRLEEDMEERIKLNYTTRVAEYFYQCPRCLTSSTRTYIRYNSESMTFSCSKKEAIEVAGIHWNHLQGLIARGLIAPEQTTTTRSKSI